MRRKILYFLIICLSFFAALFCYGCISSNEASKVRNVTTVNVWLSKDCVETDVMEDLVAEYNAGEGKEKGIKIEYRGYDASEYEKIFNLVYATNNEPEIMSFPPNYTLEQMRDLDWMKAFENIEGGISAVVTFDESRLIKSNDRTYAVKGYPSVYKLIYNCDLFEKNGIVDQNGKAKAPKTWQDVVDYSRIITENGGGEEFGIVFGMKNPRRFWENNLIIPFEKSLGYCYEDKYNFSIYERAFEEFFLKIKMDESYYPNPTWVDEENALRLFFEGNVGIKVASSFYDISLYNDSHGQNFRWDVADIPVFEPEETASADFLYETKNFMYITRAVNTVRNPEKVVEVYKMLHSDEVRERLAKRKRILSDDVSGGSKIEEKFFNRGRVIPPRGISESGSDFYTEDRICDTFNSIWYSGESETLSDALENISRICNEDNPATFNK